MPYSQSRPLCRLQLLRRRLFRYRSSLRLPFPRRSCSRACRLYRLFRHCQRYLPCLPFRRCLILAACQTLQRFSKGLETLSTKSCQPLDSGYQSCLMSRRCPRPLHAPNSKLLSFGNLSFEMDRLSSRVSAVCRQCRQRVMRQHLQVRARALVPCPAAEFFKRREQKEQSSTTVHRRQAVAPELEPLPGPASRPKWLRQNPSMLQISSVAPRRPRRCTILSLVAACSAP